MSFSYGSAVQTAPVLPWPGLAPSGQAGLLPLAMAAQAVSPLLGTVPAGGFGRDQTPVVLRPQSSLTLERPSRRLAAGLNADAFSRYSSTWNALPRSTGLGTIFGTTPNATFPTSSLSPSALALLAVPGLSSASSSTASTASAAPPEDVMTDRFLDPRYSVSSGQALGFFAAGFLLTFAGRSFWNALRTPSNSAGGDSQAFDSKSVEKQKIATQKFAVYQNYNDPLSSIYRLIQFDPSQGNALLMYVAISVLGYLSGSVIQGAKESWVRQQESKIRASLINRLQAVVRQSIRMKNEFNNQYKESCRQRIYNRLLQAGVPFPERLVQDVPVPESLQLNQHYFYEPTHRTLKFQATSSLGESVGPSPAPALPGGMNQSGWQKAFILGLGAFSGFVLNGFMQLMMKSRAYQAQSSQHSAQAKPPNQEAKENGQNAEGEQAELSEGLMLKDQESWSLMGVKNGHNFAVMSGLFAMSAAAALGKTFLNGLREIEVTRLNARTELGYQTHNWLTQDPLFHNIAEQESVENELQRLEKNLPYLLTQRSELQRQIQTILSNIGRNSAPPYYPMTPTIGLVEARS